jgi:5-methylcytosine-specific restriction endonuclease McrA
MKKSIPLPLEQAFERRTRTLYYSMSKRFAERRYKNGPRKGRIFRVGRELPFNLAEFQKFVLECLGGNRSGSCLCHYCGTAPLHAANIGLDHEWPIAQGGSLEVVNLKPCCDSCNRLKNKMSPVGFAWLKHTLFKALGKELTLTDYNDILMRLKSGGMMFSVQAKRRKEKTEKDEDF